MFLSNNMYNEIVAADVFCQGGYISIVHIESYKLFVI